jgi:hypothetical protein
MMLRLPFLANSGPQRLLSRTSALPPIPDSVFVDRVRIGIGPRPPSESRQRPTRLSRTHGDSAIQICAYRLLKAEHLGWGCNRGPSPGTKIGHRVPPKLDPTHPVTLTSDI